MKGKPVGSLAAVAAVLLVACPPAGEVDERVGNGDEVAAEAPVCLLGEPFGADGSLEVRDTGPGDADRIGGLRWERYEGCERFVIDLLARDGSRAERAGELAAEVHRGLGVVRVSLFDVQSVEPEATDLTLDGPLARAAYTVRSPDGQWTFVDVHMGDAAEAYVTTLDEPARVIVDLRPGGPPVPGLAASENLVVVLVPRPGDASYPLTVTGYARTFEANVVVRLEQAGEKVLEEFTTATAYVDAWGHYSITIEQGPTGPVVLHVGDYSARDGTWQGVAIDLEMR